MNSISFDSVMSAMATFLNYMDASTYDAQMTLRHKEFRHNIDQVYEQCCSSKKITNADCQCFYSNLKALEPVMMIEDEDQEYTVIHNELIKCFRAIKRDGSVSAS